MCGFCEGGGGHGQAPGKCYEDHCPVSADGARSQGILSVGVFGLSTVCPLGDHRARNVLTASMSLVAAASFTFPSLTAALPALMFLHGADAGWSTPTGRTRRLTEEKPKDSIRPPLTGS
jgi:hypothetical protein